MTATRLRRAALAAVIISIVAAPALAQPTAPTIVQPAAKPQAQDSKPAAEVNSHAANAATVVRADKPAVRANSRTARQVWRDRQHLPNAR